MAATLLTTTHRAPAEAAGVSFVAALAVHDLAVAYAPSDSVALKWPNDVLLNGRKLAGVLVESGPAPRGGLWLAVGVGINLASAPADVDRPAAALAEAGAMLGPESALEALAAAIARWSDLWDEAGLAPILEAWGDRAIGIGASCEARLAAETLAGTAEGLDLDGALRLRLADGSLRRIVAGDVFFTGAG